MCARHMAAREGRHRGRTGGRFESSSLRCTKSEETVHSQKLGRGRKRDAPIRPTWTHTRCSKRVRKLAEHPIADFARPELATDVAGALLLGDGARHDPLEA